MDRLKTPYGNSVFVFPDMDELVPAAAGFVYEKAAAAVRRKQFFTFMLSGGKTPERLYRYLSEEYTTLFPWEKTYFFWGDERCVPPEDSKSNFKMALDAMLGPMKIPETNIIRIQGENGKETASEDYERKIRDFSLFNGEPAFDLVLLGMGSDGHTASLFPGSPALKEKERFVLGVDAPVHIEPHVDRVTVTFPVLEKSKILLYLVSGESKKEPLGQIFFSDPNSFPAGAAQLGEDVFWYITENCSTDYSPEFR